MKGDQIYSDVDNDLIKDFESELASEERAKKKKRLLVVVGIILGLIFVIFLTSGDEDDNSQASQVARKNVKKAAVQPEAKPLPRQEDIENQIARLQGRNKIEEDFKAPGALMRDEPMKTDETQKESGALTNAVDAKLTKQTEKTVEVSGAATGGEKAKLEEGTDNKVVEQTALHTTIREKASPAKDKPLAEPVKPTVVESTVVKPKVINPKVVKPVKPAPALVPKANTKAEPVKPKVVESTVVKPKVINAKFVKPVKPAPALVAKATTKSGSTGPFAVQVMATLNSQSALDLRDRLIKRGFDSWISLGKARQQVYRVEVGEFKSIRHASNMSALLGESGFSTRTAYLKDGKRVTLIAGMFSNRTKADRLNDAIADAGFPTRIAQKREVLLLYMVRVGKYKTEGVARAKLAEINRAGFRTRGITR